MGAVQGAISIGGDGTLPGPAPASRSKEDDGARDGPRTEDLEVVEEFVEQGSRSADLYQRRARATQAVAILGVGIGILMMIMGLFSSLDGDLLSLVFGALTGALIGAAGLATARWLTSLDRRAVVGARADLAGLTVRIRDGRSVHARWTDPALGLRADPSPLFAPCLYVVVRLPGTTGLVPGFLAEPGGWAGLVTIAKRAGAPVTEIRTGRARPPGTQVGRAA